MPGKERTAADAKREFVTLARLPDANIRASYRCFGISPPTSHALPHCSTPKSAKGLPRSGKGCAEVSSRDVASTANGRARQSSLETMLGLCGRKDCVCLNR